jgi:hypothetical protein
VQPGQPSSKRRLPSPDGNLQACPGVPFPVELLL